MAKKIKCPDASWFKRLAQGKVNQEQEQMLSRHLETCSRCQQVIERISDISRLVSNSTPTNQETINIDKDRLGRRLDEIKSRDPNIASDIHSGFMDIMPWMEKMEQGIGKIHEFQVLKLIGRGGMGVVFECYDTKLQRNVALKLMSPQLLIDGDASTRFLREARSAARINHPNVVTVHGVGEIQRLPYLVMELIHGLSLEERLNRAPVDFEELARISIQSAAGLAAAHEQGILHRDIKPANIILDEKSGMAKITDFGLACTTEGSKLTQTGLLVGTPDYLSPEQASGGEVDHRSDLFSLGSVMYTMCCGEPPFTGPSMVTTLENVRAMQPTPIKQKNRQVPNWFQKIVTQLLEKEPGDRLPDAVSVQNSIGARINVTNSNGPPQIDLSVNRPIQTAKLQRQNTYFKSLLLFAFASLLVVATIVWWKLAQENMADRSKLTLNRQDSSHQDDESNDDELPIIDSESGSQIEFVVETAAEFMSAAKHVANEVTIMLVPGAEFRLEESTRIVNRDLNIIGSEDNPATIWLAVDEDPLIEISEGILSISQVELKTISTEANTEDMDVDSAIVCHDGRMEISSSKVVCAAPISFAGLHNSSLAILDSQLLSIDTLIDWMPEDNCEIAVEKSLVVSLCAIYMESRQTATVEIVESTLLGERVVCFGGNEELPRHFEFVSKGCLLLAPSLFGLAEEGEFDASQILTMSEIDSKRDILPLYLCQTIDDEFEQQLSYQEAALTVQLTENSSRAIIESEFEEFELDETIDEIVEGNYDFLEELNRRFDDFGVDYKAVGPAK